MLESFRDERWGGSEGLGKKGTKDGENGETRVSADKDGQSPCFCLQHLPKPFLVFSRADVESLTFIVITKKHGPRAADEDGWLWNRFLVNVIANPCLCPVCSRGFANHGSLWRTARDKHADNQLPRHRQPHYSVADRNNAVETDNFSTVIETLVEA